MFLSKITNLEGYGEMAGNLIVFASEQMWPNLESVCHYAGRGLLRVYIYHTEDRIRSADPARRLACLIEKTFPKVQVFLPETPCGMLPQDVDARLHSQMDLSGSGDWIINITGGTKMLPLGCMSFLNRNNCQFIYRELSGSWYTLNADPSGKIVASPLEIKEIASKRISVLSLVELQAGNEDDATWTQQQFKPVDVVRFIQAGIECDWEWPRLPSIYGSTEPASFFFEQFIASIVHGFDVENISVNLSQIQRGITLQELDVVASVNERLVYLPCTINSVKYSKEKKKMSLAAQIKEVSVTCKKIAGHAGICILVAPTIPEPPPETIEFASAMGVTLIHSGNSMGLIGIIGSKIRNATNPLPKTLAEADALLRQYAATGRRPFCQTPPKEKIILESEEENHTWLNMESLANFFSKMRSQDWYAISWKGRYYVYYSIPEGKKLRIGKVNELFSKFGEVSILPSLESGPVEVLGLPSCFICVNVSASKGNHGKLREFLSSRRGKNLFDLAQ
jgi:hypothetical protein